MHSSAGATVAGGERRVAEGVQAGERAAVVESGGRDDRGRAARGVWERVGCTNSVAIANPLDLQEDRISAPHAVTDVYASVTWDSIWARQAGGFASSFRALRHLH